VEGGREGSFENLCVCVCVCVCVRARAHVCVCDSYPSTPQTPNPLPPLLCPCPPTTTLHRSHFRV
jgi:hypothetical protein